MHLVSFVFGNIAGPDNISIIIYPKSGYRSVIDPILENNDKGIHIGNVGGDVIGVGVTGSGNVIGTNITIDRRQLQNIPSEYAESLREFIKRA